jgi:hypothetical protein
MNTCTSFGYEALFHVGLLTIKSIKTRTNKLKRKFSYTRIVSIQKPSRSSLEDFSFYFTFLIFLSFHFLLILFLSHSCSAT